MDDVTAPVANGRTKYIEPVRCTAVQIEEHGATFQVLLDLDKHIFADDFEQRMPWGHPLQRRILFEKLLVERNVSIFLSELAEPGLQPLAGRPEIARNAAKLVAVLFRFRRLGRQTRKRRGLQKKVFDHLRHKTPLPRLGGLADDRR